MDRIDRILYINLKHSVDRKKRLLGDLAEHGIDLSRVIRIEAVYNAICGHIGCAMSHINALRMALDMGWETIMILEDDLKFVQSTTYINNALNYMFDKPWDVLLLAKGWCHAVPCPYEYVCVAKKCSTASGYIVKKKYYSALIDNFEESIRIMSKEILIKERESSGRYVGGLTAIDQYWQRLQDSDTFYIFEPVLGEQSDSFSNNNCNLDTFLRNKFDISNIEPDPNNIFSYWEWNGFNIDTLNMMRTTSLSIVNNNPDRRLYIFSNTLKYDDFIDLIQTKNIYIVRYKYDEIIKNTPLEKYAEKYKKIQGDHRQYCDLFRVLTVWRYGGSYTDLDNICINRFPDKKNILCRCYDWHYGVKEVNCIDGNKKEPGARYRDVKFSLRNDCMLNFDKNNKFLEGMFNMKILEELDGTPYIYNSYSWQELLLDTYNSNPDYYDNYVSFNLNLLYLSEDFIYATCPTDRYDKNKGEMNDLMNELIDIDKYPGGKYKCTESTAMSFLEKIKTNFPSSPMLWVSCKAQMMTEQGDERYITSWIIQNYYEKYFSKNISDNSKNLVAIFESKYKLVWISEKFYPSTTIIIDDIGTTLIYIDNGVTHFIPNKSYKGNNIGYTHCETLENAENILKKYAYNAILA